MRVERVVVDTNVLISAALLPDSLPARLVRALVAEATLVLSRAPFDEFERRLWKPKFDRYIDMQRRRALLHDFAAIAEWMEVGDPGGPPLSRDPDDDVFVYTAFAGGAPWLISGDRDLLDLGSIDGLEMLTPGDALARWTVG